MMDGCTNQSITARLKGFEIYGNQRTNSSMFLHFDKVFIYRDKISVYLQRHPRAGRDTFIHQLISFVWKYIPSLQRMLIDS